MFIRTFVNISNLYFATKFLLNEYFLFVLYLETFIVILICKTNLTKLATVLCHRSKKWSIQWYTSQEQVNKLSTFTLSEQALYSPSDSMTYLSHQKKLSSIKSKTLLIIHVYPAYSPKTNQPKTDSRRVRLG